MNSSVPPVVTSVWEVSWGWDFRVPRRFLSLHGTVGRGWPVRPGPFDLAHYVPSVVKRSRGVYTRDSGRES